MDPAAIQSRTTGQVVLVWAEHLVDGCWCVFEYLNPALAPLKFHKPNPRLTMVAPLARIDDKDKDKADKGKDQQDNNRLDIPVSEEVEDKAEQQLAAGTGDAKNA